MDYAGRHVAFFLPSLAAGGVGRTYVDLANGFHEQGVRVSFLLGRARGPHLERLDPTVEVVELGEESALATRRQILRAYAGPIGELALPVLLAPRDAPSCASIGPLSRFLERERPDALLSGKTHANLTAVWARRLTGVATRVIVSERTHLSQQIHRKSQWRWRHIAPVVGRTYPAADAILSVSDGVSDDLSAETGIERSRITTLYNPIPTDHIRKRGAEPPDHPWLLDEKLRVVLGVGRLVPQKDFATLLDAFARLAPADPALRLVIVGEGDGRKALERRIARLGLTKQVALPGYGPNPYAYMARASVFVLSSTWEGLPGALLEALACSCPVVSTDCPSGPREILEDGRLGALVPVGDPEALAEAIERVLSDPPDPKTGLLRAEEFAAEKAIDRYLRLLLGTSESPSPA